MHFNIISDTLSCNNSARDIFLEKLKKGEHQTLPYFVSTSNWILHLLHLMSFKSTESTEVIVIIFIHII